MEIIRCLLYFPINYYLIESVQWPIGQMQQMILSFSLWSIKAVYLLSILFWFIYSYYNISNYSLNDERLYSSAKSMVENDIKIKTSIKSNKLSNFEIFLLILFVLIFVVMFVISFMVRIDSCVKLMNEFSYLFE